MTHQGVTRSPRRDRTRSAHPAAGARHDGRMADSESDPGPDGAPGGAGRAGGIDGQEGFTEENAVTVTVSSHSAKTPSTMAIWCLPASGTPRTIVG